jgi:mono/diheme cytochrome c family protein
MFEWFALFLKSSPDSAARVFAGPAQSVKQPPGESRTRQRLPRADWPGKKRGSRSMSKAVRPIGVLVLAVAGTGVVSFTQSSGEEVYKAKCLTCHGATGMADTVVGKALKIKPVTDPEVKSMSEARMIDMTRNGTGKMQAFKDKLTDAQIRDSVAYFRSLMK